MENSHSGRKYIDPRLLALMDKSGLEESLDVRNLQKNDVISLHTRNTIYTMQVIDPSIGSVVVNSDGGHVTKLTTGNVVGTTLTGTGTMIKLMTIILNFRLLLFVQGLGELRLSDTQSVFVNGTKIMPMDKNLKIN